MKFWVLNISIFLYSFVFQVNWPYGCPEDRSCCNEYGYCGSKEDWSLGLFRKLSDKPLIQGTQFVVFMQFPTFSTFKTKPNFEVKAKKS